MFLTTSFYILKLWLFGITGNLWLWFKAYLTYSLFLYYFACPFWCPPGKHPRAAPLLFLIYVNDLQLSASSSSLLLFANDTKCFNMVRSPPDSLVLQQDLTSLFNWSKHWKLSFNELKCILIRFSSHLRMFNGNGLLHFILNDYTSDYKSRLLKLNIFPLMLLYEYYDIIFFLQMSQISLFRF